MNHTLTRRNFLTLWVASPVLFGIPITVSASQHTKKKIGIALGGGGARCLAHLEMLSVLDDLHIKPSVIAGTSMGAVIGALYASGHSAVEIKSIVDHALANKNNSLGFFRKEILEWMHFIDPKITRELLFSSSDFIAFVHEQIHAKTFEELKIPLYVVAADIHRREPVIFHEKELLVALEATIAFPGLFNPIVVDNRLLADGGIVNPVPYDLLLDQCDISIAVDVAGRRTFSAEEKPTFFEIVSDSFQTMEKSILQSKMKIRPPDIYLKPDLVDIHLLDFAKAEQIYQQAQAAKQELKRSLQRLLA